MCCFKIHCLSNFKHKKTKCKNDSVSCLQNFKITENKEKHVQCVFNFKNFKKQKNKIAVQCCNFSKISTFKMYKVQNFKISRFQSSCGFHNFKISNFNKKIQTFKKQFLLISNVQMFKISKTTSKCQHFKFSFFQNFRISCVFPNTINFILFQPFKKSKNQILEIQIFKMSCVHGSASILEHRKNVKLRQKQFHTKDTGKSSSRKLRYVIYYTLYRMDPQKTH